jgi:hypothetical protein
MTEEGGPNLYGFVGNEAVGNSDAFGMENWGNIEAFRQLLRENLGGKPCCCTNSGLSSLSETIAGSSAGMTVTGTANITEQGCILSRWIFWWDCFSASEEAPWWDPNWKDYGWSQNGLSYSKTAQGGGWWRDASHLAMSSVVVYTFCYNGRIAVGYEQSSPVELYWTWNSRASAWEPGYR